MVELKVRKCGNSLGVVLPKEIINRLHTGEGQPLFLIESPDGGCLISPYDPSLEERRWPRSKTSSPVIATRRTSLPNEATHINHA